MRAVIFVRGPMFSEHYLFVSPSVKDLGHQQCISRSIVGIEWRQHGLMATVHKHVCRSVCHLDMKVLKTLMRRHRRTRSRKCHAWPSGSEI